MPDSSNVMKIRPPFRYAGEAMIRGTQGAPGDQLAGQVRCPKLRAKVVFSGSMIQTCRILVSEKPRPGQQERNQAGARR